MCPIQICVPRDASVDRTDAWDSQVRRCGKCLPQQAERGCSLARLDHLPSKSSFSVPARGFTLAKGLRGVKGLRGFKLCFWFLIGLSRCQALFLVFDRPDRSGTLIRVTSAKAASRAVAKLKTKNQVCHREAAQSVTAKPPPTRRHRPASRRSGSTASGPVDGPCVVAVRLPPSVVT